MPDERHPLDERPPRPHHPVEPPEVVVPVGVGGGERPALLVVGRRADPALARWVSERADRAVQPEPGEARRFAAAGAETGAPEEPLGLRRAKRACVTGNRRHQVLLPLSPGVAIP